MADSLKKLQEKRDKLKTILSDIKTAGGNLDSVEGNLEVIQNSLDATLEHFRPGGAGSEAEGWKAALGAKDNEISELNAQIAKAKEKVVKNLTTNTNSNATLYQLLEQLETELKGIQSERGELKKKMGEIDKVVDEIDKDIDNIGTEAGKVKDKSELTKNKIAELATKGLAVLGFFAGVYWTIGWVKNLVNGRKRPTS